jgi:ppGpp synthetase/RelA/SpoT-type nucleotidyltranferase
MQDIAGCRLVVDDISAQEGVLEQLRTIFPRARIVDRRKQASHGYRAVHLIVELGSRPVEIQLRTTLEHRWAELSEALSDVWGTKIKYGGGPVQIRQALDERSQSVERVEKREVALHALNQAMSELRSKKDVGGVTPKELQSVERDAKTIAAELAKAREELFKVFDRTLAIFTKAH